MVFKKIKRLMITDLGFLKPPYARYISTGGIGEKVFEEYCKQNKKSFTKPLFLMWAIYLNYLKDKYGKLTKINQRKFDNWNCGKILLLLTKEQINFLTKNFVIDTNKNFDITGFPDYVILEKNKIKLIEIKTKTGIVVNKQRKIFTELKKYFDIRMCYIDFTIKVKKLELNNIKLMFENINIKKYPFNPNFFKNS